MGIQEVLSAPRGCVAIVARLSDRSYKQLRVAVLEFLDSDVFNSGVAVAELQFPWRGSGAALRVSRKRISDGATLHRGVRSSASRTITPSAWNVRKKVLSNSVNDTSYRQSRSVPHAVQFEFDTIRTIVSTPRSVLRLSLPSSPTPDSFSVHGCFSEGVKWSRCCNPRDIGIRLGGIQHEFRRPFKRTFSFASIESKENRRPTFVTAHTEIPPCMRRFGPLGNTHVSSRFTATLPPVRFDGPSVLISLTLPVSDCDVAFGQVSVPSHIVSRDLNSISVLACLLVGEQLFKLLITNARAFLERNSVCSNEQKCR